MGRSERPVDPEAGPLQRLAWDLRQLRQKAGRPSYRELAKRAHYSASVLSEAAGGLAFPSLAVTLAYVEACGGDGEEWEKRWRLLAVELAPPTVDDTTAADTEVPPYLGLSTFQPADAARFFGRRALIGELCDRLADNPFLAVFGASGSGKSSLLRAGLLPALAEDTTRDCVTVLLTPGCQPLEELAVRLATLQGIAAASLLADLDADPANITLAARQALAKSHGGQPGPGGAWTEERSDEGRRRLWAPRGANQVTL